MPTDGDLGDQCFAYVPAAAAGPNGTKSARKLPLCSNATGRPDCGRIKAAAQAVTPGGLMGNPLKDVPPAAMGAIKRRIRAAGTGAKCWPANAIPASIKP